MGIGIVGFDHPVIAVRSLADSYAVYQRLGFTIPPRGSHIEWGTGNWCIMFARNYLEHRGIVDAKRYTHGLEHFLAVREGLMGVAFRSDLDNRDLYQNALAAGLHPAEPRELTRNFELETGVVPVSFRLVFFKPEEAPPLMASLVCEHLTPERLRPPQFMEHANTAHDVCEMTSVAASLDGVAAQLVPYFGADAVREEAGQVVVTMPDGGVHRVLDAARAEKEGLALSGVTMPYLASCAIAVRDLAAARAVLEQNGVPFAEFAGGIRVAPAQACGLYLDFVER